MNYFSMSFKKKVKLDIHLWINLCQIFTLYFLFLNPNALIYIKRVYFNRIKVNKLF